MKEKKLGHEPPSGTNSWIKGFMKSWGIPLLLAFLFSLFVRVFVVESIGIIGESMEPTFQDGDWVIIDKFFYGTLEVGDIVVVDMKEEGGGRFTPENRKIIKRVVGVAGDSIEGKEGVLYRNGERVEESYVKEDMTDSFMAEVPEGKVFLLGDNRNNSADSRYYGPFSVEDIRGNVILEVESYWKWKSVK